MARMERLQASPLRRVTRLPIGYESQFKRWFLWKNSSNSHFLRLSQSDMAKRDGRGEPSLAVFESLSPGGLFTVIVIIITLMLVFIPVQVRL